MDEYEEMAGYAAQAEAEAEYQLYLAEWQKAQEVGEAYWNKFITDKAPMDKETWLSGWVTSWFNKCKS